VPELSTRPIAHLPDKRMPLTINPVAAAIHIVLAPSRVWSLVLPCSHLVDKIVLAVTERILSAQIVAAPIPALRQVRTTVWSD
jgi:hypothetical protein